MTTVLDAIRHYDFSHINPAWDQGPGSLLLTKDVENVVAAVERERDALAAEVARLRTEAKTWSSLVEYCKEGIIIWRNEATRLQEELRPKSAAEEHNAMLHRTGQHPLPAPPGREGEK